MKIGVKSGLKKRSLSEVRRGVKRGASTAFKNEVKEESKENGTISLDPKKLLVSVPYVVVHPSLGWVQSIPMIL